MTTLKRFLIAATTALVTLHAYAQVESSISMFPKNPEPFQEVTLVLTSYSYDVNLAKITWKAGKSVLLSGVGAKQLKLRAGGLGEETTISYIAETAAGEVVTGSITVSPQFVDLIYESPESYTPPFYEGRTLPSEGARVRVTALPSISEGGRLIPISNLSFSWYINGEFYQTTAGRAGSSASIPLDYLTTATDIQVTIRSPRGNVSEKTISVYPVQPLPLLYAYDELLGTNYSHAYAGRMELSSDVTLKLEPYYLSTNGTLSKTVQYSWYIDGLPISPQEKDLLTLKPKENSYGARKLSVIIENTKRILQKAQMDMEIVFDTRQ